MQNEYEATFLKVEEDKLKNNLEDLGANLVKPRQLMKRAIFENDTTNSDGSWVRLRDEGDKITLTLKQVVDDSSIHGTKEIEFIVDDFEKVCEFLKGIGLIQKRYQENYREEWKLNDVVFDFDTWPDVPTFLEIEGPSESDVKEAAEKLGFDYSSARFGSVDSIYLEEYGRDILKEETLLFEE